MFVVSADVKIKTEKLDECKKWFSESNQTVSKFAGFVSRRLLETKDGQHRIMIEFEDMEKFNMFIQSSEHTQIQSKAMTFMDGMPSPTFYNVVAQ